MINRRRVAAAAPRAGSQTRSARSLQHTRPLRRLPAPPGRKSRRSCFQPSDLRGRAAERGASIDAFAAVSSAATRLIARDILLCSSSARVGHSASGPAKVWLTVARRSEPDPALGDTACDLRALAELCSAADAEARLASRLLVLVLARADHTRRPEHVRAARAAEARLEAMGRPSARQAGSQGCWVHPGSARACRWPLDVRGALDFS